MAYQNKEDTYFTAQSLAADAFGDWIDARHIKMGSFSLDWADAAATDAVVKVQQSHSKPTDGTGAFDISGASATIGAASGTALIELLQDEITCPWIRLAIVDNTESAGTVNAKYFFKGDR